MPCQLGQCRLKNRQNVLTFLVLFAKRAICAMAGSARLADQQRIFITITFSPTRKVGATQLKTFNSSANHAISQREAAFRSAKCPRCKSAIIEKTLVDLRDDSGEGVFQR